MPNSLPASMLCQRLDHLPEQDFAYSYESRPELAANLGQVDGNSVSEFEKSGQP